MDTLRQWCPRIIVACCAVGAVVAVGAWLRPTETTATVSTVSIPTPLRLDEALRDAVDSGQLSAADQESVLKAASLGLIDSDCAAHSDGARAMRTTRAIIGAP
ncbi:hypothetical protein C1Y63_11640 [Corynebacterium sp. 13CS0277]|uniref:hypothetical protein n=1 Tax=Corynebacterium sp. 13CS0277 TaxID=2071994 RepID=UPI000D0380AA|nr:hypothetical protein [Corynebacterium sp. 13CS0277]PRQ10410.1 hypothetical protein C1Y63_11640 [Corynebacterium sp. 13CS0277]